MAASASTLTCPQCGYINEAERVYCHNCGAKLDRSLLPREDDKKTKDSIERTRRRVRKMTNPTMGKAEVKTAVSTLIYAALTAAVYLIARQPEEVPAKEVAIADRLVASDLADALESPQPRMLRFSENDLNAHLASVLRSAKTKGLVPGIELKRAFAKLEPGVAGIGTEQSVWGWPVYSGAFYKVRLQEGRLFTTCVGGHFGRLKVHPMLMTYADIAFRRIASALGRERGQIERMQAMRIDKDSVTLWTKGAAR